MAKTLLAAYGFRVLDRILMLETVRRQTSWYIAWRPNGFGGGQLVTASEEQAPLSKARCRSSGRSWHVANLFEQDLVPRMTLNPRHAEVQYSDIFALHPPATSKTTN